MKNLENNLSEKTCKEYQKKSGKFIIYSIKKNFLKIKSKHFWNEKKILETSKKYKIHLFKKSIHLFISYIPLGIDGFLLRRFWVLAAFWVVILFMFNSSAASFLAIATKSGRWIPVTRCRIWVISVIVGRSFGFSALHFWKSAVERVYWLWEKIQFFENLNRAHLRAKNFLTNSQWSALSYSQ